MTRHATEKGCVMSSQELAQDNSCAIEQYHPKPCCLTIGKLAACNLNMLLILGLVGSNWMRFVHIPFGRFEDSNLTDYTLDYVTKRLIPPLDRIFRLVGENIETWFDSMPKSHKVETQVNEDQQGAPREPPKPSKKKRGDNNLKIDQQFATNICLTCDSATFDGTRKLCINSQP